MSRCPSVRPSHDLTVQSSCSEHSAGTLHCTSVRYANSQMGQQTQTASRTGASQPPSDAWIKVGLLPSCLHNNTPDRASAAVSACGSDYLAGRRSLWLANGPGAVPVRVSQNKSAELKLGHIPGETLIKLVSLSSIRQLGGLRMHLLRLALSVLSHSQSQWTGLDLNCHCMFVVGRLQGTSSLSGESGPNEADSRGVSSGGKERQERWYGDSMGSHTLFPHIIFEVRDYKQWLRQPQLCVVKQRLTHTQSTYEARPRTCGGTRPNLACAQGNETTRILVWRQRVVWCWV